MKVKRLFILLLAGCVLCTGCGGIQKTSQEDTEQETAGKADQKKVDVSVISDENRTHSVSEIMMVNDCSTYQVMEEQSDCIVYGKKVREYLKEPDFEGDTYDLMAEFEIEKQIKTGDKEYQAGDKIIVAEGILYDADSDILYHEGGYQKMQTEKMYYLMLGKGDESDQYYLIGGLYGKIPEDTEEDIIYKTSELGEIKQEEIDRAAKWIDRNRKELEKKKWLTVIHSLEEEVNLEGAKTYSSNPYDYKESNYYKQLVGLGLDAVPLLSEKMCNNEVTGLNQYLVGLAIQDITETDLAEAVGGWTSGEQLAVVWKEFVQEAPEKIKEILVAKETVDEKLKKLKSYGVFGVAALKELQTGTPDNGLLKSAEYKFSADEMKKLEQYVSEKDIDLEQVERCWIRVSC